jgi:DNA-directed RNA polymerase subunit RPC12/RpoP
MSKKNENSAFICTKCKKEVVPLSNGSYRNHCPHCLYSLHVDNAIGDRQNNCMGLMKPVSVIYNSKKGYQIVHKCLKCSFVRVNKIAENTQMPDNFEIILKLMKNSEV